MANYVEATAATRDRDSWAITCGDTVGRDTINFSAKVLINACGSEVNRFNELTGVKTEHSHALSKGIHLIVDLELRERRVLTFFASDGRLFFVMPMGPKTCIGTTDTRVTDPAVSVTDEDRDVAQACNDRYTLE